MEKDLKVKGVNVPKTKLGLAKMNKLIETAEKLFTEKGFFDVSISDICKAAHTAVGTFYIYFESKTDVYRYLVEKYKKRIKGILASSIKDCKTRYEKEKEGVKSFIKYAVKNPNVYNIIWGSLAVDKQLFEDYYVSFAKTYAHAICGENRAVSVEDYSSLAYMLMGITNFLGLKAIFEKLSDKQIDEVVENTVMPVLSKGLFS
ncbi:MAG: TetR/AcrR family transcriptional regulator [Clostridia bacterium]|nr:TetR/AcrR family transcriptional regulator [Clostridia bacterium]